MDSRSLLVAHPPVLPVHPPAAAWAAAIPTMATSPSSMRQARCPMAQNVRALVNFRPLRSAMGVAEVGHRPLPRLVMDGTATYQG